ncbi:MAG: ATP-binding cassette domain-containing protein [Verrucomicrobiales bacterium]|nr:ATP-binding cassette domain-containing protein [Verrucomicrobiales bacterium]MCP5556255.1 ATP-binding cassette domain-containing protein [Verrucomicrobiaceae bacterium]
MSSAPLLDVRNLKVGFQTDHGLLTAVDDVDFSLHAGKTLGIVGESGCGKSVTAMSIMRLLPQPAGHILGGQVLLDGRDLTQVPLTDMRKVRGSDIAMIFQEPMTALNPVHRVGKQIIENIQIHKEMSASDALRRAIELMKWVGIPAPDQRVNEYPHQLSGGMRQRVMIAMALSCNPRVLIADEPTTALDVTVQAQILDLIKRLQNETGMAVILITHDLGVVAETCDDVAVMYAGRIAERGPVEVIFKSPLHPYTQGLMNCLPKLDHPCKTALPVIPGMVPALKDMPSGCRFASRCPNAHDDSVLTTRQPWKECGSGHGVEACACFASGLVSSSDTSYTQTHEQQPRTDSPGALESALAILAGSPGTDCTPPPGESRNAELLRQLEFLRDWAKAEGKLIPANRWETPEELGAEHRIFYDTVRHAAIKVTNASEAGMTYVEGIPVPALPTEYLRRWQQHNELFADFAWLEGVMETPAGVCLVVGQQWIEGDVPTIENLDTVMGEWGFKTTALPECYYRASDGIAVMDCHNGNFIKGRDGIVYPIDVIPVVADAALLEKMEVTV